MEDFKITSINAVNIQKILSSSKLTDAQKAQFIHNNAVEIKQVMKTKISKEEFAYIMKNRPLIRFRPLKNSFTKKGDKILLAKALGINESDVDDYIQNMSFDDAPADSIDKVKTYVYRHGKKDDVVRFLDYELSNVKTTLAKLYKTLEVDSGGLADYFSRPIHRMDNKTLGKLYNVIDKRLRLCCEAGEMPREKCTSTSEWALVKIYQIQNNSKLIRAYNLYKDLV
ncbi:MAG: hypothetical protein NC390_02605 [Fusobacterium sp.]|nr:hypothetical protein [Fusobacterium sp.]